MAKWEYCEVRWEPAEVTMVLFSVNGPTIQPFQSGQWPFVFAQLGLDGWELTGVMPSSQGLQEYWYYFKRPITPQAEPVDE